MCLWVFQEITRADFSRPERMENGLLGRRDKSVRAFGREKISIQGAKEIQDQGKALRTT